MKDFMGIAPGAAPRGSIRSAAGGRALSTPGIAMTGPVGGGSTTIPGQGDQASRSARVRRLELVLAGLLLGLLAAEAVVRIVEAVSGRDYSPQLALRLDVNELLVQPHPYIGFTPRPGATNLPGRPQFSINSLGFKGPEFDQVKAPGTLRVAALGGSTTWGSGASSDAATWPSALARRLGALLPEDGPYQRVEVINAGVIGYTLLESFVNLKMRVMGRPGFRPDYTHVRGPWRAPLPSAADALFQWSHLYGFLRRDAGDRLDLYDLVHIETSEEQRTPNDRDAGLENYIATLREAVAVAQVGGARTVLCTFAYTEEIGVQKDWMLWYGFRLVDRINDAVRTLVQDERILFADVAAALGGRREHFVDPVRLSDGGNARLAEVVSRSIQQAGLLAAPPPR
jgi:hypothetical protein